MQNETSIERLTTDEHPPPKPSARAIARVVLLVLGILFGVIAAGYLIYWLSGLILLIVMAIFFAYLLSPLVILVQRPFIENKLERWMPRALAITIVYLLFFAILWGVTAYLLPIINEQIGDFTKKAPEYFRSLQPRLEELNNRFERLAIPPETREELRKGATETIANITKTATDSAGGILLGAVTFLPWLILIPILGFFFLKDAEIFRLAAVRAFPRGRMRGRAELFFKDINKALAAYIRAQLISCLLIGTVCTIGFYLCGVNYAILLGLLAGVLEFIPLVGPLIIGVLATTVAGFESSNEAIAVAIFLVVLRMLQDYVFYPRIVREGIHLHPLAIILAILGGGELAGVTGIFLAIPVVAVTTVTYRHLLEHKGSTGLVSDLLDAGKTEKAVEVAAQKLRQIDVVAEAQQAQEQREAAKETTPDLIPKI